MGETVDGAASFVDAMTHKNDHLQVANVVNLGPHNVRVDRRNDLVLRVRPCNRAF